MSSVSNSTPAAAERFLDRIVPCIISDGQGHDYDSVDGLSFEAAWFRIREDEWTIWLAVETDTRRVELPSDTTLSCDMTLAAAERQSAIGEQLAAHLAPMIATARR